MSAKLIDEAGKEYAVPGDKPVVVGRLQRCQVMLPFESVSREHAKIFVRGAVFTVADLNSANGTFVNGQRVTRHDLQHGDRVGFGTITLRFEVAAPAPGPDVIALDPDPVPQAPAPTARVAPAPESQPAEVDLVDDPFANDQDVAQAQTDISWRAPPAASAGRGMPAIKQRDEILQFNVQPRRRGFFGEDLSQRPLWQQALVALLVLAVAAGLFLAVRSLAAHYFSGTEGESSAEPGR